MNWRKLRQLGLSAPVALALSLAPAVQAWANVVTSSTQNECTGEWKMCIYNSDQNNSVEVSWMVALNWQQDMKEHCCDTYTLPADSHIIIRIHYCASGFGIGTFGGAVVSATDQLLTEELGWTFPKPGGCGGQTCIGDPSCGLYGSYDEGECPF